MLPSIHHNPETMDEIRAAIAAGKEVTTHTNPISVPGWQGAGYVILDPEVGDGAWKIGGGANGGFVDDGTRGDPDSGTDGGLLFLSVVQELAGQLVNTLKATSYQSLVSVTGRILAFVGALTTALVVWDETRSPASGAAAFLITLIIGIVVSQIAVAIAGSLVATLGAVGAAVVAAFFALIISAWATMALISVLFDVDISYRLKGINARFA